MSVYRVITHKRSLVDYKEPCSIDKRGEFTWYSPTNIMEYDGILTAYAEIKRISLEKGEEDIAVEITDQDTIELSRKAKQPIPVRIIRG